MPPAKKLKLLLAEKQRKITFFVQNWDESGTQAANPASADQTSDDYHPTDPSQSEPSDGTAVSESADQCSQSPSDSRRFQSRWVQQYPWLTYDSDKKKMFCQLCIDAGLSNAMTNGTDNWKASTITRHIASGDHQRAILAPTEWKMMQKAVGKAMNKEEEAIILAMKGVYWLTQEDMPLTKYSSLMKFMKSCNTKSERKYRIS